MIINFSVSEYRQQILCELSLLGNVLGEVSFELSYIYMQEDALKTGSCEAKVC